MIKVARSPQDMIELVRSGPFMGYLCDSEVPEDFKVLKIVP